MPKQVKGKRVLRKIPYKERIFATFIDPVYGVVFTTDSNKEYAYKYYHDASGAVVDITLEAL